jgi:hypothetical protein
MHAKRLAHFVSEGLLYTGPTYLMGLILMLPDYADIVTILQIQMRSLHQKKQVMMKKQLKRKSS